MTCAQQAEGNFWQQLQQKMYHVEGRLLKMPVYVVIASLRSCNAVMQNQLSLSFILQAKTALWYMTCGVGKQYGHCKYNGVCGGS